MMKTRIKIFPQVRFPALNLVKTKKKRSSFKFSRFLAQNWVKAQKKVSAHRLYAQTFCPGYKRGPMSQFCILFYANYTILSTQRGGHGPMAPPKYAPGHGKNKKSIS